MAMEIVVFSGSQIGAMEAWQEAIEAEGFELRLSKERRFDELSGHLPAQLEGHDVWFECDHFEAEEIIAHYADVDFCEAWKFALAFRIGSSIPSLLAAWIAATAYARDDGWRRVR